MDDPFAMMSGIGEDEVYKVTLMQEASSQSAPSAPQKAEKTSPEKAEKTPKDANAQADAKSKAIRKKLKQITELVQKQVSGQELNDEQLEKVSKKKELETELEQLRAPGPGPGTRSKTEDWSAGP